MVTSIILMVKTEDEKRQQDARVLCDKHLPTFVLFRGRDKGYSLLKRP